MATTYPEPSRRALIAGGIAVAAASGLGACTSSKNQGGSASNGSATAGLPTYQKSSGPAPDLPGDGGLIDDAFLTYPSDLVQTVKDKPGKGSTFTGMVEIYGDPTPANDPYSAFVNGELGSTFTFNQVSYTDSPTKFATTLAGTQLPDFMVFGSWFLAPRMADAVRAKFQPLSDLLGGDRAKNYPNLAALPTAAWQGTFWGKQIVAVPSPANLAGLVNFYRSDIFDKLSLKAPTSTAEFEEACKALTDKNLGRYAFWSLTSLGFRAFGLPESWAEVDGAVVHPYESDIFTTSLEWQASLWRAGYVHPDAVTGTNSNKKALFQTGKLGIVQDGFGAWSSYQKGARKDMDPSFHAKGLPLFGAQGHQPKMYVANPYIYATFINKNLSKDKLAELLGCLNYLAAPFGSKEYQDVKFGKEGVNFAMKAGVPTAIEGAEVNYMFSNTATNPAATFNPGNPDVTRDIHEYQTTLKPHAVVPKSSGIYVDLSAELASSTTKLDDVVDDVLRGRKSIADWRKAQGEWKSRYADKIRAAYEKALADNA